ncbi:MAG: sugar kinase [Leptolyngbyaceae cyanobacterium CRU_2_3]|nr:sugar kinase [Leptolyngbyaceae cyanobacterium CRU_2_3]
MVKRGLFVGLVTLDLVYLTEDLPDRNQKIVALDYTTSAGGPAANAAVSFSYLGNSATLISAVGQHPLSQLIRADLENWQVAIADLDPERMEPVPTASIIVTQATGDRAVVSLNATRSQVPASAIPPNCLQEVDIVLIDGHQMAVGQAIVQQAHRLGIAVVIDAGSWKPGFEEILPYANYVICSANFHPPLCQSTTEVFTYLQALKIPHIAITGGDRPIQVWHLGKSSEIPVPPISVVDTLGAGDIFHGAFCHYILQSGFTEALAQASQVAAYACQFLGTRAWMETGMKR